MRIQEIQNIRIAVISDSIQQRSYLNQALRKNGLQVVLCEPLSRLLLKRLSATEVDVALLDLHEDSDEIGELLDNLIEQTEIPIVFNDVSGLTANEPKVMENWFGKLLKKIVLLTRPEIDGESTADRNYESMIARLSPAVVDERASLASSIWVLGASLGGPEMVKRFLAALPEGLPVAFILGQHLGANFVALLAKQLDEVSSLNVMTAKEGHVIRHGEVIIAPVFERLTINPIGAIKLEPLETPAKYSPSIDQILIDMTNRYPGACNAIIFSGMGDDGKKGCSYLAEKGGRVWVQDSHSCVISAMPETIARTGVAEFIGEPEALAKQLVQKLSEAAIQGAC